MACLLDNSIAKSDPFFRIVRYRMPRAPPSLPAHDLEEVDDRGRFGCLGEALPGALDRAGVRRGSRAFALCVLTRRGRVIALRRARWLPIDSRRRGSGLRIERRRISQVQLARRVSGVCALAGDVSVRRGTRNRDVRGLWTTGTVERLALIAGMGGAQLLRRRDLRRGAALRSSVGAASAAMGASARFKESPLKRLPLTSRFHASCTEAMKHSPTRGSG